MIGVKPLCTGALTIVMGYMLDGLSECVVLHDVFIKLLFFFVVTVKLIFESFDALRHETNVSEVGHRRGIFTKDVAELFDRFGIENDVP